MASDALSSSPPSGDELDGARCTFCGSSELVSDRRRCRVCGLGDRQRAVKFVYEAVPSALLKQSACLVISSERWLDAGWFASFEISVFGGENHLDLMAIDRPDQSYDWIVCNHVLEHVEDDRKSISELMRILRRAGILQVTVPSPFRKITSSDWGYPREEIHGHYRDYGSDLILTWRRALSGCAGVAVLAEDPLTSYRDFVYLFSPAADALNRLSSALIAANRAVIRVC